MRIQHHVVFLALAAAACGGPSPSSRETAPRSPALVGATSVGARDEGLPARDLPAACTLGKGDPGASCGEGGVPELLEEVNAAIDELVQKRPELFNLERVLGRDGFYVLDAEKFYLGVVAVLQARGICAEWDFTALQVKTAQSRSERYDLLLSNGHIRRGLGSFRASCTPASFPLDPADVIHRVRVAFYAIECDDEERTAPRNGEGLLPVDCTGFVTATPKGKDDVDVDRRIHGPEITWHLEQAGEYTSVEDFAKVAFNKLLRGRDPGEFRLCATVQTRTGCLNGTVIE
jgi:hypothetical protein